MGVQGRRFRMGVKDAQGIEPAVNIVGEIGANGPFGNAQDPRHFGARKAHGGQIYGFNLPLDPRMRVFEPFAFQPA